MNAFNYRDGELFAEGVALSAIAERFGTPTYVYSRAHIEAQYRSYTDALQGTDHLVCFAVKANSNLGVLNVLARLGAGFDIVSGGELERVLAAGGRADRVVFSGVGKTREDMRRALEVGVHCFNVESTDELERLQVVAAEMGKVAPISLRVNPDVDAGTTRTFPPASKRTSSASPSPTPKPSTCAPRSCLTWTWSVSTATSARS
jgi:diaminopimelate decarboxylase (EC 4.1.1.20)